MPAYSPPASDDPIVQRLGHRPFTAVTRVRIPLGSPYFAQRETGFPFVKSQTADYQAHSIAASICSRTKETKAFAGDNPKIRCLSPLSSERPIAKIQDRKHPLRVQKSENLSRLSVSPPGS